GARARCVPGHRRPARARRVGHSGHANREAGPVSAAITPRAPDTGSLRFAGRLDALSTSARNALLRRDAPVAAAASAAAARSIAAVRANGDAALLAMALEFDGVQLAAIEVARDECARALDQLDPALRLAMERSARNIEAVHRAFAPVAQWVEPEPGVLIGRRPDPLRRVGVYAPGGRAAYPSSVLMTAIPARVAG